MNSSSPKSALRSRPSQATRPQIHEPLPETPNRDEEYNRRTETARDAITGVGGLSRITVCQGNGGCNGRAPASLMWMIDTRRHEDESIGASPEDHVWENEMPRCGNHPGSGQATRLEEKRTKPLKTHPPHYATLCHYGPL